MTLQGKRGSSPFENDHSIATRSSSGDGLYTQDPRIRRAVELLRQRNRVNISEIAPVVNLSPSRFRHLFKKELHVSPSHFQKLIRLEEARNLIAGTFLRIKEVAALTGWNDVSHFVRDYRAHYGQTPSQTRMGGGRGL